MSILRPFQDKYNKLANVDMDTDPCNPQLVLAGQVGQSKFVNSDPNNFAPRVGLAYQLVPDKLVLRSGYGIYYPFARFSPFGDSSSILVNPPYNVAVSTSSDGITPASLLKNGIPTGSTLATACSVRVAGFSAAQSALMAIPSSGTRTCSTSSRVTGCYRSDISATEAPTWRTWWIRIT